jgi:hypothetical protein
MDLPQLTTERETTWRERLLFLLTTPVCIAPLIEYLLLLFLYLLAPPPPTDDCTPLVNLTCYCEAERRHLLPGFLAGVAGFLVFVALWSLPNMPQSWRARCGGGATLQFRPARGDLFCFEMLTLVSLGGLACYTVGLLFLASLHYYAHCAAPAPPALAWSLLGIGLVATALPLLIFAGRLCRRLRTRPLFEETTTVV